MKETATQAQSRPGWDWPEILAVYLLGQVLPSGAFYVLLASGVLARIYGAERVQAVPLLPGDATRLGLWCVVLAFPVQLVATFALLWHTQRVTLGQLGLPGTAVVRQLREAGLLGLVLIPVVYGIYAGALLLSVRLGVTPTEHSFTRLAQEGLSSSEAVLLVLAACVVAPVWEELLFRGLIQPWVIARGWPAQTVTLALAIGLASLQGPIPAGAAGIAAVLTLVCPAKWRGNYAGAVLFAFVHTAAWPSPIPLLVLGLGLGVLAQRGGLVGPIVLHAVFNGVACVELFVPFLPKLT